MEGNGTIGSLLNFHRRFSDLVYSLGYLMKKTSVGMGMELGQLRLCGNVVVIFDIWNISRHLIKMMVKYTLHT